MAEKINVNLSLSKDQLTNLISFFERLKVNQNAKSALQRNGISTASQNDLKSFVSQLKYELDKASENPASEDKKE